MDFIYLFIYFFEVFEKASGITLYFLLIFLHLELIEQDSLIYSEIIIPALCLLHSIL